MILSGNVHSAVSSRQKENHLEGFAFDLRPVDLSIPLVNLGVQFLNTFIFA